MVEAPGTAPWSTRGPAESWPGAPASAGYPPTRTPGLLSIVWISEAKETTACRAAANRAADTCQGPIRR